MIFRLVVCFCFSVVLLSTCASAIAQDPPAPDAPAAPAAGEPAPPPPAAPEATWIDRVELHGFGGWAYGRTDANHYLNGAEDGDFEHAQIALSLAAHATERVEVFVQLDWMNDEEEVENEVDYAFAEIRGRGRLRWRLGQVKQPFGIYTEIFDVGTLRPFLDLPEAVYGPSGFVAESYRGVGLTGGAGPVEYDLYVGGLRTTLEVPFDEAAAGVEEGEEEDLRNVAGGRLVFNAHADALRLGLSGYTGEHDDGSTHSSVLAHVEWSTDRFTVRTEGGRHEDEGEHVESFYAEASWRFNPRWQLAVRHERLDSEVQGLVLSAGAESLTEHRDSAFGVSYWFGQNLALKAEVHAVEGNRFAHPLEAEELQEQVAAGELEADTRLFQFGVQFSF